MPDSSWLLRTSPAFRLLIATSWLAPDTWRDKQEKTIREAFEADPDWDEYLHLVERHRTPALSWSALASVPGIAIPTSARQELQKQSDACRRSAILYCFLLADVLKRLRGAGIPVMPIKGQVLSSQLYSDFGLRHSRDLDLEIAKEDLERAQACIEAKDWHLESSFFPMSPRQWESFLRNEHHINFVHAPTGCNLELHWRMKWEAPEVTSARWARNVSAIWQGQPIRAMHPGDLTLYLCAHGGQHAWSRAKWLGDVARAHSLGLLDWKAAWEEAQRTGQERVLLSAGDLLPQLYGLPRPDLPGNAWRTMRPRFIESALQAITGYDEPVDPIDTVNLATFRNKIRRSRNERLLWPGKAWRDRLSELLYHREDYRTLPLPDSLFGFYKPLRPALWLWQWVRQGRFRTANNGN